MSKMIENNRLLQIETERLNNEITNNNNKYHDECEELNKQITELDEQLRRNYEEREEYRIRNESKFEDMNKRLDDSDANNKDLMIQVEELNFTINSLKLDQDANNEHYNIKYNQYRAKIAELEEKIQYLS